MQRCLGLSGPRLHKKITFAILAHSQQTTLHNFSVYSFSESNLGNLCSVGQWLTDNIYEKKIT